MKNTFMLLILLLITISCVKEDAIIEYRTVEKIVEIDLNNQEKKDFDHSISAVQEGFAAAKKIDNLL